MKNIDSWLFDDNIAVKILDKSFMLHAETGLPRDSIYPWFLSRINANLFKIKYKDRYYSTEIYEKKNSTGGRPTLRFSDKSIVNEIVLDTNFLSSYNLLRSIKDFKNLDYPLIKFQLINDYLEVSVCSSKNEYNTNLLHGHPCDDMFINSFIFGSISKEIPMIAMNIEGLKHKFEHSIDSYVNQLILGYQGECSVLEFERKSMQEMNSAFDQALIRLVSDDESLGCDIISYDQNGDVKYIEVKTTQGNIDTPFHMSENELNFSKEHPGNYFLYRLYNFRAGHSCIEFYVLKGDVSKAAKIKAISFSATKNI